MSEWCTTKIEGAGKEVEPTQSSSLRCQRKYEGILEANDTENRPGVYIYLQARRIIEATRSKMTGTVSAQNIYLEWVHLHSKGLVYLDNHDPIGRQPRR